MLLISGPNIKSTTINISTLLKVHLCLGEPQNYGYIRTQLNPAACGFFIIANFAYNINILVVYVGVHHKDLSGSYVPPKALSKALTSVRRAHHILVIPRKHLTGSP